MNLRTKLKKVLILTIVFCMILPCFIYADVENVSEKIKGALLGDLDSGTILYEYNIDKPLALASITKLMTYTILMDNIKEGKLKLDDEMTISHNAANTVGSVFGMVEGEKIKVSKMIEALLIVSGNDVATAIAENVSGSVESFVFQMNEKAKELGLTSAIFINPNGLPEDNVTPDQNYMSVRDLYTFVQYVLKTYPEILETTKKPELNLPERNFSKSSTNPLFGIVDGVDGLKTGYTDEAGICLVSTLPVGKQGEGTEDYRIISIVMGAQTHPERIEKSQALLDYGRNNFINQKLSVKDTPVDKIYIKNAKITDVDVYTIEDYNKLIKNGETIKSEIVYNEEIKAPIEKGTKIGQIKYSINDEVIKTMDIVVRDDVEKANIFVRIFRFFKGLFNK
ncbi:D-alanyl-D-alanine carboxypeptidase [Sedimentibacter sp. zth1]|uniref:D-alanyl-D-alanine carboxypeptidase family protein n=1 Tax=Sedimentibacter sp. zth1 TaxID=2816908 RepID=UPI001A910449|nr:D-alanyl-D-alanine carboxypeptidase family protein [Sedimentibacter sp. zth1]QSX05172.1 D-alanyl-D-alanine carboxypeptidase [Sedimentibacter sp. zth1]